MPSCGNDQLHTTCPIIHSRPVKMDITVFIGVIDYRAVFDRRLAKAVGFVVYRLIMPLAAFRCYSFSTRLRESR